MIQTVLIVVAVVEVGHIVSRVLNHIHPRDATFHVVAAIFRQVRIKFIEVDDYTAAVAPEYSEVAETQADTLLLNQAQLTPPWRTTFSQIQSHRHKINTLIYQLIKFASKSIA